MTIDSIQISEREREILRLVATGATNQQIAQQLNISINTVKVHLRNIFGKIGVASRTEATVYAIKQGLIAVDEAQAVEEAAFVPLPAVEQTTLPEPIIAVPDPEPAEDATPQVLEAPSLPPAPASMTAPPLAQPARNRWLLPLIVVLAVALLSVFWLRLLPDQVAPEAQPTAAGQQPRWIKRTALPQARAGFALAAYNRNLYVVGGTNDGKLDGTIHRYSISDDTWSILAAKPVPVQGAQAVVVGGVLYLPGGEDASGQPIRNVEAYDTRTDTWAQLPDLPAARSRYALVAVEGTIYLIGGWDGTRYCADVFALDPNSAAWETLRPMPTERRNAAAAVIEGVIYVVGGENGQGALRTNEQFRPFDGAGGRWASAEPLPAPVATGAAINLSNTLFVVDPVLGAVQSFAPDGNSWITRSVSDITLSKAAIGVNTSLFAFGPPDAAASETPLNEAQVIFPTYFPGTLSNS